MKKILILLIIGTLGMLSCNDDSDNNNPPISADCNSSQDPANEIAWIRNLIDDNQSLNDDAHIFCYELDGNLVFLVDLCLNCGNGYDLYDCEENLICTYDQVNNTGCVNFQNNAINELEIWKNY
jgi:hypothetical protein